MKTKKWSSESRKKITNCGLYWCGYSIYLLVLASADVSKHLKIKKVIMLNICFWKTIPTNINCQNCKQLYYGACTQFYMWLWTKTVSVSKTASNLHYTRNFSVLSKNHEVWFLSEYCRISELKAIFMYQGLFYITNQVYLVRIFEKKSKLSWHRI